MSPQIKSSLLGFSLALTTALGCIAYEKLVKNFSIAVVMSICVVFYIPFIIYYFFFQNLGSELKQVLTTPAYKWYMMLYLVTWITTPIWYVITRNQSVMAGSIYEAKYIVLLAVIYWIFGSRPMTWNLITGMILALASIYFVSKK